MLKPFLQRKDSDSRIRSHEGPMAYESQLYLLAY